MNQRGSKMLINAKFKANTITQSKYRNKNQIQQFKSNTRIRTINNSFPLNQKIEKPTNSNQLSLLSTIVQFIIQNLQKMLQSSPILVLHVQFCKSCPTHNWCTHHDEQKYLTTYQKLKQFLEHQFAPRILVQGNLLPQELLPIKPAQNKFFSTKTNKYVTFPSIGAFQVTFDSQLIFSKKNNNTWPNFAEIAEIIHLKLYGQPRSKSPSPKHTTIKNMHQKNLITDVDIKTQKDHVSLKNQSFLDHNDKRSTFYKNRSPNQHKNFTLTDHFKNYHNGNYKTPINYSKHLSDQNFTTANTDNENVYSEISSFRNGNSSEKEFLEFKKNFETFGLEGGKLPDFFKKKAFLKENSGKKEMIIRLDSIEEQSVLMDENNHTYAQNINLTNTHTTFKSKSKEKHKKLMKRFTDDFEQLEAKFKNFQQKVETIREENKKFDQRDSSSKLNDRIIKEINDLKKKQKRLRSSQNKQTPHNEGQEDQMIDNPIIFARKKLKNIQDYINGTEQQKNSKLKKIYGEWKLLKKPYKGRNYVSPYKLDVSKRTGKTKINKNEDQNQNSFSSSCSQSEPRHKKQNSKPKIPKHNMVKMMGLKSSKSNQQLQTKEKFYSTARDKFERLGSRKVNHKMSEKKFDSFSNNSAEKQFQADSVGVNFNTFDHITQGQKNSSQFNGDSRTEVYPYSFNQKDSCTKQKGNKMKSIPKRKAKENFLSKQTSSRQMSRSLRKIQLNQLADKYLNEDQKLLEVSGNSKINSNQRFLRKAEMNKKFKNSQKIGVRQNSAQNENRQQSHDSNGEYNENSREYQDEMQSEKVEQLHQNSLSLQDNFFQQNQSQFGSVDNNFIINKESQQKSIIKTHKTGNSHGQIVTTKSPKKITRKIAPQNQVMNQGNKWTESIDEEQNQIDLAQQPLEKFVQKNLPQNSLSSQNQVITTNQHKLMGKSKTKKQSLISETKKSSKINPQDLTKMQSQNLDNQQIYHDSHQFQIQENTFDQKQTGNKGNQNAIKNYRQDRIEREKQNDIAQEQKQIKNTQKSSSIRPSKKHERTIIDRGDDKIIVNNNSEQQNNESLIQGLSRKQVWQKIENQVSQQKQAKTTNNKLTKEKYQSLNQNNSQQIKNSIDQSMLDTSQVKKTTKIHNKNQKIQKQSSIKLNDQQEVLRNDPTTQNYSKIQNYNQNPDRISQSNNSLTAERNEQNFRSKKHLNSLQTETKANQNKQISKTTNKKTINKKQINKKADEEASSLQNHAEESPNKQIQSHISGSKLENLLRSDQSSKSHQSESQFQSDSNSEFDKNQQDEPLSKNVIPVTTTHKKNKNEYPPNQEEVQSNRQHLKEMKGKVNCKVQQTQGQDYEINRKEHLNLSKPRSQDQQNEIMQSSNPNQSFVTQHKLKSSQQNVRDLFQKSSIQNYHSQDQNQTNKKYKAKPNQQEKAQQNQQQDHEIYNSILLKESSCDKKKYSNQEEQTLNGQKSSKRIKIINHLPNFQNQEQNPLQQSLKSSNNSDTQSQECRYQKTSSFDLNQNSATGEKTLKNHKTKKGKKLLSKQKQQKNKQPTLDDSINENKESDQIHQDFKIQKFGQNKIKNLNDTEEEMAREDVVRKEKPTKPKNAQVNQNLNIQNSTHGQLNDQLIIGTSRSTRNKILNIYQTDRCKDLEEGSDEGQLDIYGNSGKTSIAKDPMSIKPERIVQSLSKKQRIEGEAYSRDVGIQMDSSEVDRQNSYSRYEAKVNLAQVNENNRSANNYIINNNCDKLVQNSQSEEKIIQQTKEYEEIFNSNSNYGFKEEVIPINCIDQSESSIFQRKAHPQISAQPSSPKHSLLSKVLRAPLTKQFYGPSFSDQLQVYPNSANLPLSVNINQLPLKSHLTRFPPTKKSNNWILFNSKSIQVQQIQLNHPLPNLIKCIKILAEVNQFLVVRLFEDPFVMLTEQNITKHIFGVWLCVSCQWKCVLVNLKQVLLSQEIEQFYYMTHNGNQLWPLVLQKALAQSLGSYQKLRNTPCYKLFNILTGSNSLSFNIKQDPTKNGRILRYISDCENKNFVIHADKVCKNLQQLENKDRQARIYYVISQRTVNENDTLLQIRESTKPQSQWTKLSKFVQEFKSIQILQLRINHNFSTINIPKPISIQSITIVSLQFENESFGSITLSTDPYQVSLLRTSLYKEEKSNYLKLVGQATEKNKATLFFDCCFSQGKYWLFVESVNAAKVTYLGENQPKLQLVEEIKGEGLKNDWTEYLPVKTKQINTYKQNLPAKSSLIFAKKMNTSKLAETKMSFKSQQSKISRLRQNFVDYLLKDKGSL